MTLWYCLQKFKQLPFHNCNPSFQLFLRHDPFHLFVFQSLSHPVLSKHFHSNLQHFWHFAALHLLMPMKEELQCEEWGLERVKQYPSSKWALESVRCFCPARQEASCVYRGVFAGRRPLIKHWHKGWKQRSWRILQRTNKDLWKVQHRDSLVSLVPYSWGVK